MISFKRKLSIARRLSLSDWLLVAQSWWVLVYFHLALGGVGFETLQKKLKITVGKETTSVQSLDIAWKLQRLVYMASRIHLLRLTCLDRACTLQWMLSKRGNPSDLRIGVNKSQAMVHAHAWVEVAGQAIGEPEDIEEQFSSLNS